MESGVACEHRTHRVVVEVYSKSYGRPVLMAHGKNGAATCHTAITIDAHELARIVYSKFEL